jgi:hypothetical protein
MQRKSHAPPATLCFRKMTVLRMGMVMAVTLATAAVSGCRGSSAPKQNRDWTAFPAIATAPDATEIYAVGDLHGDVTVTASLLSALGLISPSTPFHWTGADKVLVVVGDVIDKGDTALPVIDLLSTIEAEARAAGGRVIVTLGNHEAEFLGDPSDSKSLVFQTELTSRNLDPERIAAGEGKYGAWLTTRPVAAQIGGWFFCHAGNTENRSVEDITTAFKALVEDHLAANGRPGFLEPVLAGKNSMLQAQGWWQGSSTGGAAIADANLAALPAQHLVFGHEPGDAPFPDDPQGERKKGQIAQRYDGRLFMIDVGMSSAVGYSDGAALQIVRGNPDRTTIVTVKGQSTYLWP